jgi:hypothetical protein
VYAKIFSSLYKGTMRGQSHLLLVFTNLLANASSDGWVDMHPAAIADEVGLTTDEVKAALLKLEATDPDSRSPEEDGRRIVRLDEHRSWGWRIVNYVKYRQIRNEDDRREQNRLAQARWRENQKKKTADSKQSKPQSAAISSQRGESAQEEGEGEVEASKRDRRVVAGNPSDSPGAEQPSQLDCPHAAILDAWKHALPELTQHDPDLWSGTRADHLRARWRERASAKGWKTQQEGLEYLAKLFVWIRDSDWLMGRVGGGDGRAFKMTLEWLVMPSNWAKVLEGKYHANNIVPALPVSAKDRERKAIVDKWMGEFAQTPKPVTVDADATPQQNLMLGG